MVVSNKMENNSEIDSKSRYNASRLFRSHLYMEFMVACSCVLIGIGCFFKGTVNLLNSVEQICNFVYVCILA